MAQPGMPDLRRSVVSFGFACFLYTWLRKGLPEPFSESPSAPPPGRSPSRTASASHEWPSSWQLSHPNGFSHPWPAR